MNARIYEALDVQVDNPVSIAETIGHWCDDCGYESHKFLFWAIAHEPGDGTFDAEVESHLYRHVEGLLEKWQSASFGEWHYDRVMADPSAAPAFVRRHMATCCLGWAQDAHLNGDMENAKSFAEHAALLMSY